MATMYYRPYSGQPLKDDDLPPHDALEGILPDYHYIFVDPDQRIPEPSTSQALVKAKPKPKKDVDETTMGLLDYQMKELEKYRVAVHTMGSDILTLRRQIQEQESENSRLRLELGHYGDSTRLLLDSTEMDGLTKPELSSRYVSLKQKLNSQTTELKHYKDKVVELQNDLIKKNDREKEYLRLSTAHVAQQELVQKLQDRQSKVRKLEEACRKQEKVIERMERLMRDSIKDKDASMKAANEALMDDNRRLRTELEEIKDQQRAVTQQHDEYDREKMDMYHRLDKSDKRIESLEKQLSDNARRWAREKSDLEMALREAHHGLDKPDSPVIRTYPKIVPHKTPEPKTTPRRYTKAPLVPPARKIKGHNCNPKLEPLYSYR